MFVEDCHGVGEIRGFYPGALNAIARKFLEDDARTHDDAREAKAADGEIENVGPLEFRAANLAVIRMLEPKSRDVIGEKSRVIGAFTVDVHGDGAANGD